jgi:hypothetical protein
MAVGFEKMAAGSLEKLQPLMEDRTFSVERHVNVMSETYGLTPSPITCQVSLKQSSYSPICDIKICGLDVWTCRTRAYGKIRNQTRTFC